MMKFAKPKHYSKRILVGAILALALYAPTKDVMAYLQERMQQANIAIIDASFGAHMPWQSAEMSYVKVAQQVRPSFTQPQMIYTRLRLENPTSETQTYRKIWLNFDHQNGSRDYTTEYTLYNAETRQPLIGQSVQVGAHHHIDVIAAYRFIPSYRNDVPTTMSVSWEGNSIMRNNACSYDLKNMMTNNFHTQCL